jgi:hypothetical protein
VPTQIIAELFKSKGFDGIWYKSLLSNDGCNLALFNLDDAEVISCGLWEATSIRFDSKGLASDRQAGNPSPRIIGSIRPGSYSEPLAMRIIRVFPRKTKATPTDALTPTPCCGSLRRRRR